MENLKEDAQERKKIDPNPWDMEQEQSYEDLLQWIKDNSIETASFEPNKNIEKR